MNIKSFLNDILSEICLDDRIKDGIFRIENTYHKSILREYLTQRVGYDVTHELMENLKVDEGNFPERQAYNKDGILVTFPDAESKKAALKRGSHFPNDPTGGSAKSNDDEKSTTDDEEDDTSSDSNVEDEEPDTEDLFSDFDSPEKAEIDKQFKFDLPFANDDDFEFRERESGDDTESDETHHVYDVLDSIKTKIEAMKSDPSIETSDGINWDMLHPTILFALKQKWEFDKSGRWFDENNKFRASTDRRGILDPAKVEDKDEMLLWMDDYLKRKGSKADV